MIHYHGGPVTPTNTAIKLWSGRHAFVSWAAPYQVALAAEVCQSFALDNGAFTAWRRGEHYDFKGYTSWVAEWRQHPGFDFAIIPDKIDGTEEENDRRLYTWPWPVGDALSVPVWHLHETLGRLDRLVSVWRRVALGSSGEYRTPGTAEWWKRMDEAMAVACDSKGRARAKLHGLRMLDPTVFSHLPLSSADSTSIARNVGIDCKWKGTYQPASKEARALVLASRIEVHASAARYTGSAGVRKNRELVG